jgi:hypothetical protein
MKLDYDRQPRRNASKFRRGDCPVIVLSKIVSDLPRPKLDNVLKRLVRDAVGSEPVSA